MQFKNEFDPTEPTRAELLISGRVQGVFYRQTMLRAAEQGGLAGSATNLPDGRVRVVFEGPSDAVMAAVDVARVGPPAAQVEHFQIEWTEPLGEQGFATS